MISWIRLYRAPLWRRWLLGLLSAGALWCTTTNTFGAPDAAAAPDAPVAAADKPDADPAATRLYSDAANFQNNKAFELAVEAWGKFLQQFPQDDRAEEARYNAGISELQLATQPGDDGQAHFDRAVATLEQITHSKAPSLAADAWLNLGLAHYTWALRPAEPDTQRKLLQSSVESLTRYLTDYSDAARKDQALFYRGEGQYLQQELDGALASYQQLVDDFPGSPLYADALYALGVALEEKQEYGAADEKFALFLEKQPDHALTTEVTMRRAEALLQQKKYDAAAKLFETVATTPDFAQADQALFRQGYCWASLEDYRQAADKFIQLTERFPESSLVPEATIAAGRSLYRLPDAEAARDWYGRALQLDGTPQAVVLANEAAHWLNRDALQRGIPDEVVARAESRIPLAAESDYLVHLKLDRADALYQIPDRKSEALTEFESLAREYPGHYLAARALYNAAFSYLEMGDFDKAKEIAGLPLPGVEGQPTSPLEAELRSVAAEASLQNKQYDVAQQLFAALRESGPETYRNYWGVRQALCLHLAQDHAGALKVLDAVHAQLATPTHQAESFYVRGLCQLALGEATSAESSFQESLRADGQWKQADETWFALARAQRRTQGPETARATIAKVWGDFPDSRLLDECYLRSAEYAYSARLYPDAIEHYQKVIADWPQSQWVPYSLYGIGWSQLGSNDAAQANAAFSQLLEQFPEHALAARTRYARGVARHRLGEFDNARSDLEQFVHDDPSADQVGEALYLIAVCSTELKQPERAAAALQTILNDFPDFRRTDRTRYDLAWAMKEIGQNASALEQFSLLVSTQPESALAAEATYHLAEDDYANSRYDTARERYQLVQKHPTMKSNQQLGEKACYKEAWCYFQTNQLKQALQSFKEQVEKFPAGTLLEDARFMIGECHYNLHDYDQALESYRSLDMENVRSEIRPLMYLHGGQSAAQLKRWEESLKWLQVVPDRYADSNYISEANYEIGWAYHQTGRAAEAMTQYRAVAEAAQDAVGARARFMLGEMLFEQKQYAQAVQEFQRVMYGYGGNDAPEPLHVWQAKSGFEAGQCASLLARTDRDAAARRRWIGEAVKAFRYVVESHPKSEEAESANQRLQQLGTGTASAQGN